MQNQDSRVDDLIRKNDQAIRESRILVLETFYANNFLGKGLSDLPGALSRYEPAFIQGLFSMSQAYLQSQPSLSKKDQEALLSKDEIQIIKSALDLAHWQYHYQLHPTEETKREDALFDAQLEQKFQQAQARENSKWVKKQRWLTAFMGAVFGLAYGCLILLLAWSFNRRWGLPYWNSLAAFVDAPLVALLVSLLEDTYRGKWKNRYTYKSVLFSYFLFSLLGAFIILYRWNKGIDELFLPVPYVIGKVYLFLDQISPCVLLVALIVAGVAWFYNTIVLPASLGLINHHQTGEEKLSPGCLVIFWESVQNWFYGIALVVFGVNILFDSIHSVPWIFGGHQWLAGMVNLYPFQITLSISILIGLVVGFIASDLPIGRWQKIDPRIMKELDII